MNMKQRIFGIVLIAVISIPVGVYLALMFERPIFEGYLIGLTVLVIVVVCIKMIDPVIDFYVSLGGSKD